MSENVSEQEFLELSQQKNPQTEAEALSGQSLQESTKDDIAQSAQENSRFAMLRRKNEAQQREKETRQSDDRYESFAQNFSSDGISQPCDYQASMQELQSYREREMNTILERDLSEIRSLYPDENAKSIDELGEQYLELCASGIKPVLAYEALRLVKQRERGDIPSMGDVNTTFARDKDFYSREEVEKMSQSQVNSQYEVIRKSMEKWR